VIEGEKGALISAPGSPKKPGIVLAHLIHTIYLCPEAKKIRLSDDLQIRRRKSLGARTKRCAAE
jgi:hypothetical protein